jgi:tetratricopeptide (TPR) repeat protein
MNDISIEAALRECRELRKIEKYVEAVELLSEAIRRFHDARLFYSRGITFDQMDQPERAIEDITSAILLDKTNSKYYFNRACILSVELGRDHEAIPDFEQVLEWEPDNIEARQQCCLCLLIMGRPNRALEHAEAALRLAPGDAVTHFCLGEAYMSLERFQEAVESFRRAVELDSTQTQYSSALNRALEKLG